MEHGRMSLPHNSCLLPQRNSLPQKMKWTPNTPKEASLPVHGLAALDGPDGVQ